MVIKIFIFTVKRPRNFSSNFKLKGAAENSALERPGRLKRFEYFEVDEKFLKKKIRLLNLNRVLAFPFPLTLHGFFVFYTENF